MSFFLVIYMCYARLHYLRFWSVLGAVVVLDCKIVCVYIYIYIYMCVCVCVYSFNPSSDAVGLKTTVEISYFF
jgi:hypothetical protein